MTKWQQGQVDANGISINYYRTGGDKPVLILAHGFSDNGLCWTRVARELESTFDVIMVDARNHGESGRKTAAQHDLADDLAGVIEALDLVRAALMGHSMGAATVAELASRRPDLVSRVVLEDPPWMTDARDEDDAEAQSRREGFREYIKTMAHMSTEEIIRSGRKLNPAWHEDEFPAWAASKKQVSDEAMQGIRLHDWREAAKGIQCPALLVYADTALGGIVGDEAATEAKGMNPLIEPRHIAGAGHNIRRERFDEFLAAVTSFLTHN